MGWTCSSAAAATEARIAAACRESTGSSNTFITADGRQEFYEVARKSHEDGRLAGLVHRMDADNVHCRKVGRFVIAGNGTMPHGPAWMRAAGKKPEGLSWPRGRGAL